MFIFNHSDRLFISLASGSRLNNKDYGRTRAGRMCLLDLNSWSIERVFMESEENFVTSLGFHPDRQLLFLGMYVENLNQQIYANEFV